MGGRAASRPAAPVDGEQLAAALQSFGASRMLPKGAYIEPAVLAWEQAHVFDGWLCVGRSSDVGAGSPRGASLGDTGVLLARDLDGTLRAFENTCRHRGHELLPCGVTSAVKAIVCPYHAWTYDFDGSLIGAPGFRDVTGFESADYPLTALSVIEWHGWVFVDPSGAADEFDVHVGDLAAVVSPYDGERLVYGRDARVRRRGELEGGRRELPGVLPLLDDPSRAVPGQPAGQWAEPRTGG